MAGKCSRENCYPEETGCNHEGCDVLTNCKYYQGLATENHNTGSTSSDNAEYFLRIPWTGNAMGLNDLSFLSSTTNVIIIGITGVASAGKTTFLATLYCLLRHGAKIGDYQFSGSFTLNGWENIAWYLSWKQNNEIQFPPHTSSNAGRVPGLLHISLRNSKGEKKELVFTDAPGEWFDNWSFNQNDVNAKGAIWIYENADAFLLFADCDMLSGIKLGIARKQTRLVADRLKQNLDRRPLGLIWSKSDIKVDDEIKHQITEYVRTPDVEYFKEFQTSVREGDFFHQNIRDSIDWILSVLAEKINVEPLIAKCKPEDMFLSKR